MRIVKLEGDSLAAEIAREHSHEAWKMAEIDVPADGACFFQSIAIAMNEDICAWYDVEELRAHMERYWDGYTRGAEKKDAGVTSSLIRYMCAENIDEDTLATYNAEAEYRKSTLKEKDVVIYESVHQYKTHVLKPDTWVDHASFGAFLKSLDFRCGLVVFDPECEGIKYLPPEWTVGKSLYIFLLRRRNHYSVMRLEKDGTELQLCVSYEDTKEFVDWMADNCIGNVLSEF